MNRIRKRDAWKTEGKHTNDIFNLCSDRKCITDVISSS
jgi:hypothetical protein